MANAKFYDPDKVVIYFAGITVQGYADGSFVEVARLSPAFKDEIGTDGEVARSKTNDRRLKVTVKLIQTSSTNSAFSSLLTVDENAPNGAGVGSFQIQDLQGATLVSGAQAWLVGYPDQDFDRTAKSREWEIRVARATVFVGGN